MEQVKEYPLLMQADMVRATLDLTKTQTRRLYGLDKINIDSVSGPSAHMWKYRGVEPDGLHYLFGYADGINTELVKCPYGKPSDRLWVREAFQVFHVPEKPLCIVEKITPQPGICFTSFRASRILLEIVSIRVERVQDISAADCEAEGLKLLQGGIKSAFAVLWDTINAQRGFGWAESPWVWAIEFKQVDHAS